MDYRPPTHEGLDILFQDEDLLVVNKPSGLLSVPGRGEDKQDCMISRVQQEYPQALIVHRLDMATSGILLLALNKTMQSTLSQIFQNRAVNKTYTAVVDGQVNPSQGEIDLPLITDWPNRPLQKVDHIQGKASRTLYRVLSVDAEHNSSRLALTPITGRSHQLRVHMQVLGHVILGDELYAPKALRDKAARLLLHASQLSFRHPKTQQQLQILSQPEF